MTWKREPTGAVGYSLVSAFHCCSNASRSEKYLVKSACVCVWLESVGVEGVDVSGSFENGEIG